MRKGYLPPFFNDPRMAGVGWLKSAIILSKAIIIPSLLYSSEVWAESYKYTEKTLEDEYKSMLYWIFDVPTHTKWASFLADTGLPNIIPVADKLRINFINFTLWGRGDAKAREILREEERNLGENSTLAMVDKTCLKYGIPKVSTMRLDPKLVKRTIKVWDETEIWVKNLLSPITNNVSMERLRIALKWQKLYKREAQAIIAYNAGALRTKMAWKDYYKEKKCLAPLCGDVDSLSHIKTCRFYRSRWKDSMLDDVKELAAWLVKIDEERRFTFKWEKFF